MNVTTERLENCQVNVIIEMDPAEVDEILRQAARKISRQVNVPGYRRGKAPFHAVVRAFGRETIQQQAMDDRGQSWYEKALEEIEYKPYQPGELKEVAWEPFRMTVLLPIQPEVDLGDYRSVRVPFEVEPVTEEAVDAYLRELQEMHAQWAPVERPAAVGDQVMLDAEGKVGDEVVWKYEYHEMRLAVGASQPLPGFHEEIVGVSAGETKVFRLPYLEDEEPEGGASREATFTVRLQLVKGRDLPPLDDDLALMVGDFDSLEALRASVRERLETQALQQLEAEYGNRVLDAMIETAKQVEYPPQAVDREADMSLDRMERNLASAGVGLERYLGMLGKTRAAYKEEIRPAAETRLRRRLVVLELAAREGLEVEDDEIEARIERLSEGTGPEAEELRALLSSPEGHHSVADDLLIEKAHERAIEIGKGEAPPLEERPGDEEEAGEVEPAPSHTGGSEGEPDDATRVDAEAGEAGQEGGETTGDEAEGEGEPGGAGEEGTLQTLQ